MEWTVSSLKKNGVELLQHFSETARLDVDIFIQAITKEPIVTLIANPQLKISEDKAECFFEFVARRAKQEPVAYIINEKGFYNHNFYVDNRVLIPRPETELLVENGISHLLGIQKTEIRVLDLGCGSGCIGLSILSEVVDKFEKIELVLSDISQDALEVAKINLEKLKINNPNAKVEFTLSDWFDQIEGKYDLIVSNPPYIQQNDPRLYSGYEFEPSISLFSLDDGFKDLNEIVQIGYEFITKEGSLICEFGQGQEVVLSQLITENDKYKNLKFLNDLSGITRAFLLNLVC